MWPTYPKIKISYMGLLQYWPFINSRLFSISVNTFCAQSMNQQMLRLTLLKLLFVIPFFFYKYGFITAKLA
jgi:hypothetical protein